jgi:hypothetical protein
VWQPLKKKKKNLRRGISLGIKLSQRVLKKSKIKPLGLGAAGAGHLPEPHRVLSSSGFGAGAAARCVARMRLCC